MVQPSLRCSLVISERICTRKAASRLDSGSSSRNTLGCETRVRPMATRWR
ncbi:Uncharacterised protein [Vibrio cholerae]|nr:Uncharacterised protein [Vibrio cholerae]